MLRAIGADSLDAWLAQIPADLRAGVADWPAALAAPELLAHARALAAKNTPLA